MKIGRAYSVLVGVLAVLVFTAAVCQADTLQIGGGTGTDPVFLQNTGSFSVNDITSDPVTTLYLLFAVPTNMVAGFSVSGSNFLLTQVAGPLTLNASSACGDVYTCFGTLGGVGLTGLNNSNSYTNFIGGAARAGLPQPASYTLLAFSDGAITTTKTFSGLTLPDGTYIDAFGVGSDGKLLFTAFTNSGLEVPEPASMTLLAAGLAGLGLLKRRRL